MVLNRYPPPPRDFFRGLSRRGPAGSLGIDIGGWTYRLEGMDSPLRGILEGRYGIFAVSGEAADCFRVRVLDGEVDHFVPPEPPGRSGPHPLTLGWEGTLLTIRSYGFAGWISLEASEGEIALGRGEFERPQWCVENYLRVCTAWKAVREGGILLHAASLLRSDRVHVFLGPSGSGKSTLAATSREGTVVSDDLTLIRRLPSGFRVAGTPFRGTHEGGRPVQGFFPLAGIYRIFKSDRNRLESCPRGHAVADLLASCPFVVDQLSREPDLPNRLRALDAAHPVAYLHFNLEGNFWEVLPPE